MRVVSNTSPIIFLSKLNALHLFSECFTSVCIPNAVCKELGDIHLPELVKVEDITPSGRQFVDGALGRLHIGELEAMVLCREIGADYVLLDDMTARGKAKFTLFIESDSVNEYKAVIMWLYIKARRAS